MKKAIEQAKALLKALKENPNGLEELSKAYKAEVCEKCNKSHPLEKRCWEGYKPVPGKKPYSKGSCEPVKKEENPDKEADAKLGEDVEHLVEDHMIENKDAEMEEGHKIFKKDEMLSKVKSLRNKFSSGGKMPPKPADHNPGMNKPLKPMGDKKEGEHSKVPSSKPQMPKNPMNKARIDEGKSIEEKIDARRERNVRESKNDPKNADKGVIAGITRFGATEVPRHIAAKGRENKETRSSSWVDNVKGTPKGDQLGSKKQKAPVVESKPKAKHKEESNQESAQNWQAWRHTFMPKSEEMSKAKVDEGKTSREKMLARIQRAKDLANMPKKQNISEVVDASRQVGKLKAFAGGYEDVDRRGGSTGQAKILLDHEAVERQKHNLENQQKMPKPNLPNPSGKSKKIKKDEINLSEKKPCKCAGDCKCRKAEAVKKDENGDLGNEKKKKIEQNKDAPELKDIDPAMAKKKKEMEKK